LEAGADMAMPMLQVMDGKSLYAFSPDEQMELLRRLTREIKGPVMAMGSAAPRGYTSKDMKKAGYAFLMYAAAGLQSSGNAMAEMFRMVLKDGTDLTYLDAHPGPLSDALDIMKLTHLDAYTDMERKYTALTH
jgi:2-methylisocitrate lyase-like PEP mutase family enzyme